MVAFADAGITTFDCADIYTGVEELIGAFRARYRAAARRGGAGADQGAHQVRAGPRPPAAADPRRRGGHHRPLAEAARDRAARPRAAALVGLRRPRLARGGAVAGRAPPRRQDRPHRRHQLRHRADGRDRRRRACRSSRCRCSIRCSTAARRRRCAPPPPRAGCRSSATAPSPAASSATAGSGGAEPAGPLENRSLTKYKLIIDDFGGWDLFQALLAALRRRRRPPRQRHRHGGERRGPRPAGGGGGDRRRAQPGASRREPRDRRPRARRGGHGGDRRGARARRAGSTATSMRSSATGRGATARS